MTTLSRFAGRAARALLLAALAAAGNARAQDDAVRIVASRLPMTEAGVAQRFRVFGRDAITPRVSLTDLLRSAPELHVDQPGAPAGFASLYLRGADPSHTVYLIDGVRVNDLTSPRGGGFDLGSLDPQAIERMEVLPGASSALYGADAMAGVVGIRSMGPQGTGQTLRGGAGGLGYKTVSATHDGSALRTDAGVLEDGGRADLGFRRVRSVSLRSRQVSLRAWQHETRAFPEDSGGPRFAVLREQERRDTTNLLAAAEMHRAVGEALLRLRLGALAQEQAADSPGVAPGLRDPFGLPRTASTSRFSRWNTVLTAELPYALAGVEYQREVGDTDSVLFFGPFGMPASFSLTRETRAAFAEVRTELSPQLSGQAGFRLDDVDRYGVQTNAQAGLRYALRAGPSMGLSVGTGFKPPSFFALGNPLVGNPDLQPEESETSELSIATSEVARARQRLSLFRSRYRNLVDFDAGPPPRLVNRSDVTIQGLEYSVSAELTEGITANAGFSSLSFELPPGAGPLRSRPHNKASASLIAALTESARLQVLASRVGRVFDSSIPTGGQFLAPYLVVDTALSYDRDGTRLTLAVDNLLDRDYEQFVGFPAPGRRLRFQAAFQL